jgi:hypothetical protein
LDNVYWNLAVSYVDANGALDPTFGDSSGYTICTIGDGLNQGDLIEPSGMLVNANGEVLIAATYLADGSGIYQCALVRFTPEGHLDVSFGTNGRFIFSSQFGSSCMGVLQQSDGRVLVGASWSIGETAGLACLRLNAEDHTGLSNIPMTNGGGLSLWPNPNHEGHLTISVDDLGQVVDEASITVLDMFGRSVLSNTFSVDGSGLNYSVDLGSAFAKGMYVVQVSAGEHVLVRKLVID